MFLKSTVRAWKLSYGTFCSQMPSATDLFCVFKDCLLGNSASEAIKCLHKKKILTKVR